jgi:probable addiction module antidote protein
MKNSANNPMQPGKCHFRDDRSPFAAPISPEPFPGGFAPLYESEERQDELLNDALAIGHAPSIAAALGLIARVRGMSGLAAETGIKRQNLYRALGADGNPTLETLTKVVTALGYRLSAEREQARGVPPTPY